MNKIIFSLACAVLCIALAIFSFTLCDLNVSVLCYTFGYFCITITITILYSLFKNNK